MNRGGKNIGIFELYYPIVMSIVWIVGSFYENLGNQNSYHRKSLSCEPTVDILMSCHNEENILYKSVESLANQNYENYKIILIDDGSDDNTIDQMKLAKLKLNRHIEIIQLAANMGKAHALNVGLSKSKADFILCVDADSITASDALGYLVDSLLAEPQLGAVTGRPVVLNTVNLISKLQYIEYFLNVDCIKRAQAYFCKLILTVSGVLTLYRTDTLKSIGGWNEQAMTEDINATWKIYDVDLRCGYVPEAICYIRVPETIRGFVKQRIRWSRGGLEVWKEHIKRLPFLSWNKRVLMLDMTLSYLWIFLVFLSIVGLIFEYHFILNLNLRLDTFCAYYLITLLFYIVANIINRGNQVGHHWRLIWLIPIYFFFYWVNNIISTIIAFYSLFDQRKMAFWEESDRGKIR